MNRGGLGLKNTARRGPPVEGTRMVMPRDDEPSGLDELVALIEDWRDRNAPLFDRVRRELDEDARETTRRALEEAFA